MKFLKHTTLFFLLLLRIQTYSFAAIEKSPVGFNVECCIQSKGILSFRHNGQLFAADAAYARGYAVAATKTGYLTAANTNNMVLDIEMPGMIKQGVYLVSFSGKNKCSMTVNHTTFFLKEETDFIRITITAIKQEANMLLLTGYFEGQLHDKKGNMAVITEGSFATHNL